mgnify:FL=1|jgi:DNA-binding beta-propeller fold protein YncE
MRTLFTALFSVLLINAYAQPALEKVWETDATLAVPESVLPFEGGLYVSLIDGQPWEDDGKGGIGILDKNGKVINATWVTGLSAPKGMGIWEKKLYVADISRVVVINTATGKVESKINVEGAENLNDISIDDKGVVYVSDSKLGNVHQIVNGKPELYISNLKNVNGVKAVGNDLYLLTANDVIKADRDKKLVTVATTEIGGDGIEPVGNGDFIISCWPGLMYYMDKNGKLTVLLDTRDQQRNTADIGYDAAQRIVYVPTFFKKSVVAYRLK